MNGSKWNRFALALVAGIAVAGTTHTVVKGDTLWDITGHYLGNPFQWPMVWKNNPQIKNAHWIYPGDTVHIDGQGKGQAPSGATDGASSRQAVSDPLANFQSSPTQPMAATTDTSANRIELIVPPDHTYLNDEVIFLAPELVPRGQYGKAPFEGKIDWEKTSGFQQLFPGVLVQSDLGGDKVKLGDRVVAIESGDQISKVTVADLKGRLEQVRAILVVAELRTKSSLLRVEKVFGQVTRATTLRTLELPPQIEINRFLTVAEESPARVVANTASGKTQLPGSFVFIDRGEAQGLNYGDIIEFMDATGIRGLASMRGYGMVVRKTPSTATVLVVGSAPQPILPGDHAWRIRRAARG